MLLKMQQIKDLAIQINITNLKITYSSNNKRPCLGVKSRHAKQTIVPQRTRL